MMQNMIKNFQLETEMERFMYIGEEIVYGVVIVIRIWLGIIIINCS